jgi:hypothetical protein
MLDKHRTSKSISSIGLILGAMLLLTPFEAQAQSSSVRTLAVNRDAYVGWVSLSKAKARSTRRFSPADGTRLLEPFAKMIKAEYDGEITNFQFRYHLGRRAFIIRGQQIGSAVEAYLYQDQEFDFSEWANIPSTLTGAFVALPRNDVNRLSDEHQKHFETLFGRNVMLEDMQIEFTGSRYLVIGAMRWKPPNTHLHAVIVIKIED